MFLEAIWFFFLPKLIQSEYTIIFMAFISGGCRWARVFIMWKIYMFRATRKVFIMCTTFENFVSYFKLIFPKMIVWLFNIPAHWFGNYDFEVSILEEHQGLWRKRKGEERRKRGGKNLKISYFGFIGFYIYSREVIHYLEMNKPVPSMVLTSCYTTPTTQLRGSWSLWPGHMALGVAKSI